MKITDVRTMRLKGPRPHTVGGEEGVETQLILRIETDAGIYGLGEAEDFMGVREAIDYIRACLIGRSPFDLRPFCSEMVYGTLPPHPTSSQYGKRTFSSFFRPNALCSPTATPIGPIIWAISGVEIALCDLIGKALKTPVYNLLGGKFRDQVIVYLDRSSPSNSDDLEAWKRLAAESVEQGFKQLKFDAEYVAPEYTRDFWNRSTSTPQRKKIFERLNSVRHTVGWDVELALDCHMHYNVVDAIQLAKELEPLGLMWLEDPTPITNPDACASVKASSSIPICVGEMFIPEQFRLFIDRGACDIMHPDILFCGGLHEARRIAEYGELHYLPMAIHGNGGSLTAIASAHVAAATRNFLAMEYHFIEAEWINLLARREGVSLFRDGYIPLTDAFGLGVELDLEICEKYLMPGESLLGTPKHSK